MRGCAWMCRGHGSAAPSPFEAAGAGQGARPFPSTVAGSMHEGGLMPSVPKVGAVGDPCPSCRVSVCVPRSLT